MVKLVVSTYIGKGSFWLYLDGKIISGENGAFQLDLPKSQFYVIQWLVEALPGTSYSLTISSPKEAEYQLTKVIDQSCKDFGGFKFRA